MRIFTIIILLISCFSLRAEENCETIFSDSISLDSSATIDIKSELGIVVDTLVDYPKVMADPVYLKPKFIKPNKFFVRSKELNPARIYTTAGGIGVMYGAANLWWSSAWYSQYDRGKFSTFNDNGEWLQIDKSAHMFNAYFLSRWGYDLFKWGGVKEKNAIWIGMLIANMWQLSIELNDGFVPKWGFSWGDMSANLTGSAIMGIQQYLWHDQKFALKISAFPQKYSDELRVRTDKLYGTTFGELILKDYNATTFWLTASPGSFIKNPNSKFPKWINVAIGYGGKNMLGGFENRWCSDEDIELGNCPQQNIVDRSDIARERQFYLSLDVDFTKIPTKKPALKTFFEILNIVKIPFPALEYNTERGIQWNWLMF